ncbi:SMI1/KNR4 family protein [Amycolatopsis sp. NPDC059090]|uniref:SMI1/KNR4 family protein n=1 Tax=Amycolatopsis sp. NPDC059090 TaxID=3346723 RepID=UPI00366D0DEC
MPHSVNDLADYLCAHGIAEPATIVGCRPAEVEQVRADMRIQRLPAQYEQFLLRMGRGAGGLLRGSDFFYPAILGLSADGRDFLEENGTASLMAPGSIVIGMHQGYRLYWLECGEPSGPVRCYTENADDLDASWPSLLAFLASAADEERRALGR